MRPKDAAPPSLRHRRLAGVPAMLLVGFLVLPLAALVTTSSPEHFCQGLAHPLVLPAPRLSLLTTFVSLGVILVCGTPLAWWLARRGQPRGIVETLVQI